MAVYFRNAREINHGIWRPYHFFQSIGYPLLISSLMDISSAYFEILSCVQTLASGLTLIFFFLTCRMWFDEKMALLCILLAGVHYPWMMYPNFVLPESIFTFLLSICAYCSSFIIKSEKNHYFAISGWAISFAIALWFKGTHAFWGPLFLLCLFWQKKKKALPAVFLISFIVGSGLLLHGYLSWSKTQKFQLTASTGGLNFVEGKCESKRNTDSAGFTWLSPLYHQLGLSSSKQWDRPFTNSSYFFKEGLKCIQKNPVVLVQSLEAIPFLFFGNQLWPFNQMKYQNFARLFDLGFTLFALIGLAAYWVLRPFSHREWIMWTVPVLSLFLCAYVFKSELRYRVPFDLWIIPVALLGWNELIRKRRIS